VVGSVWGSGLYFATPGVPTPPLDLHLLQFGIDGIDFEWSPPASDSGSPITEYRIYTGEFGNRLLATTSPSVTRYTDHNITYGVRHFYNIRAVNQYSESEPSNWIDAQMPPSPPMNLTAKAGSGSVYLSWEPPEFSGVWGVDEYDILRKGGRETEWTYIGVVDGSLTHFNDTNEGFHNGPLSGTTYQYYITATIYYSESAPSNTVTATTSLISPDHVAIIIGIDYPRLTLGSGSIYTIGKYVPSNEPFREQSP
jgi:hypothetical protein